MNGPTPRLAAASALEILPVVGSRRRLGPSREHDQVHGEQLFDPRFLEVVASQL